MSDTFEKISYITRNDIDAILLSHFFLPVIIVVMWVDMMNVSVFMAHTYISIILIFPITNVRNMQDIMFIYSLFEKNGLSKLFLFLSCSLDSFLYI